ncbi:phytochrome A-associated F-box protein [Solanum stenotomum]|uniref:phytochrome A-associated F-box protein n=1 Tax=Solanum stenotomum TaxID=172797 RepID=UPI0020D1D524|nr:phytochrome A-associated F-box protein [Solanum stenotomum]
MSNSCIVDGFFSKLSEDLVLNIFFKLEDDPRNWTRLSCVSTKFEFLIHTICYKSKCTLTIPSVVSDLVSSSTSSCPLGGWSSLYKLAVCCPGLHQAGVLLENSDFGLERELGPDENYLGRVLPKSDSLQTQLMPSSSSNNNNRSDSAEVADCGWSLFDDLMFDTVYDASESTSNQIEVVEDEPSNLVVTPTRLAKRRKIYRSPCSHLASGVWNLSREQGNKLLASRFKGDCLYICDWPGCIHMEEKRNYMLFRGIFKNFKQSRVWRTINDGNRKKIDLNCAFCSAKQTWDLHSAFCLRRYFGYHDDGEPVVRAYVCENGHVSGAWTDWPLYT